MSWVAVGVTTASVASGFLTSTPKGPDIHGMQVNAQATGNTSNLMQQYNTYMQSENLLPTLYAYAGFSKDQITSAINRNRNSLATILTTEAHRQRGTAWGANASLPLEQAANSLIGSDAYGKMISNLGSGPQASGAMTALPDMTNLPEPTAKLDPNIDYRQAGGGKFVFDPNVSNDPVYQFMEQRREFYQNMSDASKGLLNSGYSASANTLGSTALAAQQGQETYGRQFGEFGAKVNLNQMQTQQDTAAFNRVLGMAGQQQQGNIASQQIAGGQAQTGTQTATSAGVGAGNVGVGQAGIGLQYQQGYNNLLQGGAAAYLQQSNFQQLMNTYQQNQNQNAYQNTQWQMGTNPNFGVSNG